ncbi:MAG TPA: hypothetical protein EYP10_02870 [Armatimonadetes bacterium]|nr:hypothetical protein [Armatimonadota bacterium]
MDTGGFKGQRREVPKEELYAQCGDIFGIPDAYLVNEYGMAEMCSQFYDAIVGQPSERIYQPPPWVRTLVLEPNTLEEVADGEVGVLRHYDLANRGSVMVIQTDDMGRKCENGFILLGRAPGAELRGCSLLSQEWRLAFNR